VPFLSAKVAPPTAPATLSGIFLSRKGVVLGARQSGLFSAPLRQPCLRLFFPERMISMRPPRIDSAGVVDAGFS